MVQDWIHISNIKRAGGTFRHSYSRNWRGATTLGDEVLENGIEFSWRQYEWALLHSDQGRSLWIKRLLSYAEFPDGA